MLRPHPFVCLLAPLVVACSGTGADRLTIATSVYPVEFVARQVAGPEVDVVNVTPPGAEPHDVELNAEQVIDLIEADLVVYLGSDFQPAVEEGIEDARGETLDALETIDDPLATDDGADAHFWLDPTRLIPVAEEIAARLAEIRPERADAYRFEAGDLRIRLLELDETYQSALSECRSRNFVTSHEAFGYLAERYRLTQTGIAGLDPEADVSPQRVADVVDFVLANDVETIFFERLLPSDAAETIARETGAETSTLDPLESEPESGDYFTAMESNLANLRKALQCR